MAETTVRGRIGDVEVELLRAQAVAHRVPHTIGVGEQRGDRLVGLGRLVPVDAEAPVRFRVAVPSDPGPDVDGVIPVLGVRLGLRRAGGSAERAAGAQDSNLGRNSTIDGNATISATLISSAAKNGITPMKTSPMRTFCDIALMMKTLRPTGGVISPSSTTTSPAT